MYIICTNFDIWLALFWYFLTRIPSFNTVFPWIFALQQTRTCAEHSKHSNQALDWTRKWKLVLTFTTPFSNVPTDKLHPQFLATIFEKKSVACTQAFMVYHGTFWCVVSLSNLWVVPYFDELIGQSKYKQVKFKVILPTKS